MQVLQHATATLYIGLPQPWRKHRDQLLLPRAQCPDQRDPVGRQAEAHRLPVPRIVYPLDQPPRVQRVDDALDVLASESPLASDIRNGPRAAFSAESSRTARACGAIPWAPDRPSSTRAICRTSGRNRRTTSQMDSGVADAGFQVASFCGAEAPRDATYDVIMTSYIMSINIEICGRHVVPVADAHQEHKYIINNII